jgi:hypothetical protein
MFEVSYAIQIQAHLYDEELSASTSAENVDFHFFLHRLGPAL